jgi:putative transposase
MILKDKKLLQVNNFHLIKLLVMLDQVLTLKGVDLENFLKWFYPIVLKKLSLLPKIDYVDLDTTLLNGYVMKTIQKSWFLTKIQECPKKVNLSEMFYPLSKFIHVNGMDKEDTIIKVKKIKLQLTSHQKQLLQMWNNHARVTYNMSISRLNTDIDFPNKLALRNQLVSAESQKYNKWILETPKEIRARAVFEAYTRVKTGIQQIKNKTIKFFNMNFKDKKYQRENGWSIDIQKQSIKKFDDKTLLIYPNITKKSHFKLKESIKDLEIKNDCKIHFDGLNYFIIIPYKEIKRNEIKNGIISLDPGIRTFLSGVDTNKKIEIGDKANEFIYPLLKKLDKHISKKSKIKKSCKKSCKKFKELSKQIKHLRNKIKNLQQELHKKTSSWLCKNYKNIIIPDFESVKMSKKVGRQIKSKTVRQMSVLAHKEFIQRLKTKAIETNSNVLIVEESYTSKTCSSCLLVKDKKFTSKRFKCDGCKLNIDRDTNGSINIFKKLFN